MAFLYVDARSGDFRHVAASMRATRERFATQLAGETRYLDALDALRDGRPWGEARTEIAAALGLGAPLHEDARISAVLQSLRERPDKPHALEQVARKASLSPSRFLHLFKAATGVPFRRYRMWMRMGTAVRSMTAGRPLTEAALAAGFASSSHFSSAFREMFGLSPSQLAAARLSSQDART